LLDGNNYKAVWSSSGYRGLPIEELAGALNQRLPVTTPIRLSPGLESQGQWAQRLKEGLYPRRIEANAALTLDVVRGGSPALVQSPQGAFVLTGPLPAPPASAASGQVDFSLHWGRVLLQGFAAFGWGAALAFALARLRRGQQAGLPLLAGA